MSAAQLDWLQYRVLTAAPADQVGWLEHLAPRLHDAASDRLDVPGRWLLNSSETTLETLSALAHAALANGATDLAAAGFAAVQARRPGDLDALRWTGTLAFYAGRTADARAALDAYVQHGGREPEPIYQLGELLRASHDDDRAAELYRQALDHLLSLDSPSAANRALLANVLVRVEEREQAATIFEDLLRETPDADHIRADYVVALIAWDDFGRAARVLAATPEMVTRTSTDLSGPRRLDLLRVQVLTHDGHYADALRLLDHLAARYPTDPDVWVARGGFDADRGRTAAADQAYTVAAAVAPGRDDVIRLRRLRAWQLAPQLALTTEARHISNGWDEQASVLNASGRLGTRGTFALTAERRQFDAPRVLRSDGSLLPLHAELQRLEVTSTLPIGAASTLAPSLFVGIGTAGSLGGGVQWSRDDLRGRTEVNAEVSRPFWEFLEGAADGGVRDRLAVQRQWRFRPDTAMWGQVAWHQYRLASRAQADSVALSLGFIRTIRREKPGLTLQYGLDKETRHHATSATTDAGFVFNPVPLVSREVHLAGVIGRFGLGRLWDGETTAGYTVDRFGGHGSFFTTRLSPKWGARAGVSFWLDRRLYALATTQQVLRGGAQLMVRFR
mgnify:CR=1 FL=1